MTQPKQQPKPAMGHTPGPWEATGRNILERKTGGMIATARFARPEVECVANARLIAAAPQMEETLRIAVVALRIVSDSPIGNDIRYASTIEKALQAVEETLNA